MAAGVGFSDRFEVSKHARRRIRRRLGVNTSAVDRVARNAYANGVSRSETRGALRDFLTVTYKEHYNGTNIKVYRGYVYVFAEEVLVTVLMLPRRLMKAADKLEKRKRSVGE